MIKVNLMGAGRNKAAKVRSSFAFPTNALPFVLFGIVIAAGLGGYFWYSSLDSQIKDLNTRIASLQKQKAALDAVIKQDQVYEARKKALETRIRIIEGLKRNQVNPILAFDVLSQAVEKI